MKHHFLFIILLIMQVQSIKAQDDSNSSFRNFGPLGEFSIYRISLSGAQGASPSIDPKGSYTWGVGVVKYFWLNSVLAISPECGLSFGELNFTATASDHVYSNNVSFSKIFIRPLVSYQFSKRVIFRGGVEGALMAMPNDAQLSLNNPFSGMVSVKYIFVVYGMRFSPEVRYYHGINNLKTTDTPLNAYIDRISTNRFSFTFSIW